MGRAFLISRNTMADLSTERVSYQEALEALLDLYSVDSGSSESTVSTSRLSIINSVKAKIDEIVPEGEGVQFTSEDEDNISDPYTLLINSVLNEAATHVLLSAPLNVIDSVKSDETAGIEDSDDSKIGVIKLPDNYLRFVALKMSDWKIPVSRLIVPEVDTELYAMQQNEFVRGGTARPMAAISNRFIDDEWARVIEYYSVDSSHAIDYLLYVQETEAEDIQSNLTPALTWNAAGMILQITEQSSLAQNAFAQEQLYYEKL